MQGDDVERFDSEKHDSKGLAPACRHWIPGRRPTGTHNITTNFLSDPAAIKAGVLWGAGLDSRGEYRVVLRSYREGFDPPCGWIPSKSACSTSYQRKKSAKMYYQANGMPIDGMSLFSRCEWSNSTSGCFAAEMVTCYGWGWDKQLYQDGEWLNWAMTHLIKIPSPPFMPPRLPPGPLPSPPTLPSPPDLLPRWPAHWMNVGRSSVGIGLAALVCVTLSILVVVCLRTKRLRTRMNQLAREKDRLALERSMLDHQLHGFSFPDDMAISEEPMANTSSHVSSASDAYSCATRGCDPAAAATTFPGEQACAALGSVSMKLTQLSFETQIGSSSNSAMTDGLELSSQRKERSLAHRAANLAAPPAPVPARSLPWCSDSSYGSCSEVGELTSELVHERRRATPPSCTMSPTATPQSRARAEALARTLEQLGID